MSALTCIIDYDLENSPNRKNNVYSDEAVSLFVDQDYQGKFFWTRQDSTFILLIGSAFFKEEFAQQASHICDEKSLQKLGALINDNGKPELFITGFYNIVVCDSTSRKTFIHNSHFGMRPLFYSASGNRCIISTQPESIVQTGFIDGKIQMTSALQFFLFNYIVNEDTIFKGVFSLPAGSRFHFSPSGQFIESYFDSSQLISKPQYNYKDSIEFIHEKLTHVTKKYTRDIPSFSLSITGGWDGRLILSLLQGQILDINTYSHGTPHNPDILIPQHISEVLNIKYTPYILDKEYYEHYFLDCARKTVENSAGLRSVTRAHYLFSVGSEMKKNPYVFTGICGSNLMKGGNNKPSPVLNVNATQIIENPDFDAMWASIMEYYRNKIEPFFSVPAADLEDFRHSLQKVHSKYHDGNSLEYRLYRFMLNVVERKYFGTEVMSYSDLGENLSPLIDIEFIEALTKTPYFGAYMRIKNDNIFANWRNSLLYANIINTGFPELGKIPSDKGVSLYDLSKVYRWPWVAKQQIVRKFGKKQVELYDHSVGIRKILEIIQNHHLLKKRHPSINQQLNSEVMNNMISFLFWASNKEKYS